MSFLCYFPRVFRSSRPWGSLLIGMEEPGGRKLASSEGNPVGGRLQPRAPGSGQAGSRWPLSWAVGLTGQPRPSVSPCPAEASSAPGREEARAQGPAVPSGGGSCDRRGPGLCTELCPEPRGLRCAMWHLILQPAVGPRPSALGAPSLSHWTTGEVPPGWVLHELFYLRQVSEPLLCLICNMGIFQSYCKVWGII